MNNGEKTDKKNKQSHRDSYVIGPRKNSCDRVFSDCNEIKLHINTEKISLRSLNTWTLNNILLNNP